MTEAIYESRWTRWVSAAVYLFLVFSLPCVPSSTHHGCVHRYQDNSRHEPSVRSLSASESNAGTHQAPEANKPKKDCGGGFICSVVWPRLGEVADKGTSDPVAFFTIVLALSTIGLWWVTWNALKHARSDSERQAKDTVESLKLAARAANAAVAAQRPWIKVDLVFLSATISTEGATLELEIGIENAGSTPATDVVEYIAARPVPGFQVAFDELEAQIAAEDADTRRQFPRAGYIRFPGEKRDSFQKTVVISKDEIANAMNAWSRRAITINFSVSVYYRYGDEIAHTTDSFVVWTTGDDASSKWGYLRLTATPFPFDQIKVTRIPRHNAAT